MSKPSYIGAPACFKLELCCQQLNRAFGEYGCFLVGSALERPDWRDVDVRFIMQDGAFARLFPQAVLQDGAFQFDPRWLIITVAIAGWLSSETGLPIDFQFQPQSFANERHNKPRNAMGLWIEKPSAATQERG